MLRPVGWLLILACLSSAVLAQHGAGLEERHGHVDRLRARATLAPRQLAAAAAVGETIKLAPVRGGLRTVTTATATKTTSTKATSTTNRKTTSTSSRKTTTTSKKTTTTTSKKTTSSSTKKTTSTKATTTTTKKTTSTSSTKTSTSTTKPTSTATGAAAISRRKKGISYNNASFVSLLGSTNVSWAYDWYSAPGPETGTLPSGITFEPMLWSNRTDHTRVWATNAAAAKKAGSTHALGFNEPDLKYQSNMTVDEAVGAWKTWMQPYRNDFKLVSPAMTNGGSPMGITYMKNFLSKCTGCQVDAVALHWYDAAWNVGYFKNYLTDAINTFAPRPIWLTEFRGSGTAEEQIKFINTVVPWMNQQAGIERYAIFGLFEGSANDGNLVTNGKLNEVGKAYARAI